MSRTSVAGVACAAFLVALVFLAVGEARAGVSVTVKGSARVTTGDGGAELSKIKYRVSGREVTFYFAYRVWNDKKTPITQLHIMRGGRVMSTFYNAVPPKSPGSSGSTSVKVPVPHGAVYNIALSLTLARSAREGAAHAEQSGGYRAKFAKVTSD